MAEGRPLFSIVIPTRNRGHLLPFALKSALAQTFDDYEIVIVANNPTDSTPQVVRELATDRVRYFQTDTLLPMPDNWEFAWSKARGEYVIYLCDDDALVPDTLATIAKSALHGTPPLITWEDAVYYYPEWHEPGLQNILLLFYFGDQVVEEVPASRYLRQCATFTFEWSSPIPKLLNSAAKRDYFEGWRQRLSRLFFPLAPDYSFAWIATQICQNIRVIHEPLSIRGISDHSIGSNAGLGDAGKEFLREFRDPDMFGESLVTLPVSVNLLASTFLKANHHLREAGITPANVDWPAFVVAAAKQLRDGRERIDEWQRHSTQLTGAAASLSPELEVTVKEILASPQEATASKETLRELRDRTARMAGEYAPNLQRSVASHAGDRECALCILGMNPAVLAQSDWDYIYLFGEELGAKDPYEISQKTSRYYELLTRCRAKQRAVKAST